MKLPTSTPYAQGRDNRIALRDDDRSKIITPESESMGCASIIGSVIGMTLFAWASFRLTEFLQLFGF